MENKGMKKEECSRCEGRKCFECGYTGWLWKETKDERIMGVCHSCEEPHEETTDKEDNV